MCFLISSQQQTYGLFASTYKDNETEKGEVICPKSKVGEGEALITLCPVFKHYTIAFSKRRESKMLFDVQNDIEMADHQTVLLCKVAAAWSLSPLGSSSPGKRKGHS